jgi:hypothetical protein
MDRADKTLDALSLCGLKIALLNLLKSRIVLNMPACPATPSNRYAFSS